MVFDPLLDSARDSRFTISPKMSVSVYAMRSREGISNPPERSPTSRESGREATLYSRRISSILSAIPCDWRTMRVSSEAGLSFPRLLFACFAPLREVPMHANSAEQQTPRHSRETSSSSAIEFHAPPLFPPSEIEIRDPVLGPPGKSSSLLLVSPSPLLRIVLKFQRPRPSPPRPSRAPAAPAFAPTGPAAPAPR